MNKNRLTLLAKILAVSVVYFAGARLGLSLASFNKSVSPVWPPTAIAIGAILLFGYRIWPGILIGAFLANLLTPLPATLATSIAAGNTLEALSAGILLKRLDFHNSFGRAKDVFTFVITVLFCTMISATIGNVILCIGKAASWQDFGTLWSTWWLGDLMGALALAPLFLTWGTRPAGWFEQNKFKYVETALLWILLSVSAMATFGEPSPQPLPSYLLTRLMVPLFLWAAFRLGPRGVTLATLLLSIFAIWGTAHNLGPFAGRSPNEALLQLQLFIGSNAVIFLFLSALVDERRVAQSFRHQHEQRLAGNLAIARILAESPALPNATVRILRTICEMLNWEVGDMWTHDPQADVLRCLTVWHSPSIDFNSFGSDTSERVFPRGEGLPGRVWSALKSAWIPDVTQDDNFPRAPAAIADGLHAAVAFPILSGGALLGVMEFFSHEIREPNRELLATFDAIGNQIGQFMQRKRAEENLLQNQEALRLAHKVARGGTWQWNLITNDVEWSDEYYELLGLDPKQSTASFQEWSRRIHPEDLSAVLKEHDNAIAEKRDIDIEFRIRRADGQWRWFHRTARCVNDRDGKAVQMIGITFDVTERKQADEVSRRFAAIVQSSDDAIVGKDLNGIITAWNAGAERLFGYRAEEMIGKPVALLIPAERPDEEPGILAKLRRGEIIDHYETIRRAKDGRRIDVSLTVSPIRDGTGRIIGASKIARDITLQKRAEREREELLASEQAARAEAEIANRMKDEFLATLSHELRTPLNAIVGWAGMLRSGRLEADGMSHAIEIIDRNARVQTQLIDDILDVSRIVSGKVRLDLRPIKLREVIHAAVESIKPAADSKGVNLEVIVDRKAGPVSGDPDRIQQIVWNLLANAIKFTPAGGAVSLHVRNSETHVEIRVEDTGEGISSGFLPHVFERFRQADGSLTRQHKGLGLGLAIVRHLVELHGGSVSAKSEGRGKGATFKVALPLLTGATEAAPKPRESLASENPLVLDGLRILLIDDERDARELHSMMLQNFGAQVDARASGLDGFAALSNSQPDILICDLEMPEMDGYAFISKLRQDESVNGNARIPALALTAHARAEDRERALRAGFQSHLAKPVEPAELARLLSTMVERK